MDVYLSDLKKILLTGITSYNLISIEKTDEIRQKNSQKKLQLTTLISFEDKELLKALVTDDGFGYYLFITYSNDCGTVKINSLNEFNFEFSFNSISSGIITLTREDLTKEIVLDFYREGDNQYLKIEIYEV